MSDLDQLRERTRQNREALSDEIVQPAPKMTSAPVDSFRRTPVAGDKVLDRVTGQEGIIENGQPASVDGAVIFAVRLPGGGLLLRPSEQLVLRPKPPSAA